METMNINKWQARIEKRRNDGAVLAYVDGLIRQRHVSLEDVTSFLTSDELQEVRNTVTERVKREAEEKAREEADRAERERKAEENRRLIAAFYEQNPPLPPTTVPEIKTESELFDVLARYHIAKVECSFEARYHWEELECIEYLTIEGVWLPPSIEIGLDELPVDDDGGIGDAISEVIERMATQRAVSVADKGHLHEGTVTFDVPSRRITVDVTAEVTGDLKISWAADEAA